MQESYPIQTHASFRLDIKFPISVESDGDLLKLWHSLSYCIIRQPHDLLAHTRRVRLCQQPALDGRLAGALADLEYVLDGRGSDLLQRLRAESHLAVGGRIKQPGSPAPDYCANASMNGRVLPTMTQLLESSRASSQRAASAS